MTEYREQPTVIVEKGPNSFQSCMGCVGYVIAGVIALSFFSSLTTCGTKDEGASAGAEQTVTESAPAEENQRPTLALQDYEPFSALQRLDPQWGEAPFDTSSNYSESLGLLRVNHYWRNTNLTFDLADGGGVYMIQVRSGLPGRCNEGPDLALAYSKYAGDLAIGPQANELKPKLIEAWASKDGWEERELGNVLIRAIGGCPKVLVIKAL